jgi:mercuric ion transport protein
MRPEILGALERATSESKSRTGCGGSQGSPVSVTRWFTAAGVLSALGVCAACCLLPFLLVSLGITSAWVGTLDRLASFKWYFVAATSALLGYGFYVAYFRPRPSCAKGSECPKCAPSRAVRIGLWLGLVLAIGGLLFEQIEPLLS